MYVWIIQELYLADKENYCYQQNPNNDAIF